MNNKEVNKKKKKGLLVMLGVSILTVLGSTLAYFSTSSNFTNIFKTGIYEHSVREVFESPNNWTPGTTTSKTVTVNNTGSIPMALRASINESWTSKNGDALPLKQGDNTVAIINFNEGWTKDADGYYYYGSKANLTSLEPNTESSSFISGVTFNENISSTLTSSTSEDSKTITYTSSGDGYDGATYNLTITIDTIQYDEATNVWN
jgi:predicted ribosomally synthesized peptide with SipW-like signal peptide